MLLDLGVTKDDYIYAGLRGNTSGRPQGRQLQVTGILRPGTCILLVAIPDPTKYLLCFEYVIRFLGAELQVIAQVLPLAKRNLIPETSRLL